MRTVLVPIDGSECSLQALHYLIGARDDNRVVTLHLLNVQPTMTGDVSQFIARSDLDDYRRAQCEEALRPARDLLEGAGIAYQTQLAVGHVADCITRCAEELDCDHIVMGTHGRSALTEFLVGSTTLKVLHHAKVPVVLVK